MFQVSCFRKDEVGNICISDDTIEYIGRKLFQKGIRKVDKKMEVKKSVMQDMRLLGRLLFAFRNVHESDNAAASEMFLRKNFQVLEQAIDKVTVVEDKLKYGVKNNMYYLLISSANIIKSYQLINGDDSAAQETDNFVTVLEQNQNSLFGDASYAINVSRQKS